MKTKIYILLIFSIIFLTGCTSKVDIELTDDTVKEKILITEKNNILSPNSNRELDAEIAYSLKAFEWEFEHYEMTQKEIDSETTGKEYYYETPINTWTQFSILRKCYDKVSIKSTAAKIIVESSDKYRCGYLYGANDVTLNIKSKYIASETNADSYNKKTKTYTWNIDQKNSENKPIKLILEKNPTTKANINEKTTKKDETTTKVFKYLIIAIIIIAIIGGLYVYIKVKNSNK